MWLLGLSWGGGFMVGMVCSNSTCTLDARLWGSTQEDWPLFQIRTLFQIRMLRPGVQCVSSTLLHKPSSLCVCQSSSNDQWFKHLPVALTNSFLIWVLCQRQCVPVNGTNNFRHHWFWTSPFHCCSGNLEHSCQMIVGYLFPSVYTRG